LLIIHLKGEVYELKQEDNDYQSLLMQIQTVEQRIRKATQERDQA
jgi:chromosome segregation ATPase